MSTIKQVTQKSEKPLLDDVKELFATAKNLNINLADVARKLNRSRFHIYKVRDGEYSDPKVINLIIRMVKKEQQKIDKQKQKIKDVL